jgi:hypothetical protein
LKLDHINFFSGMVWVAVIFREFRDGAIVI